MNDPEQQLLKPTTTAAPRERRTRLVGAIAAAVFLAAAAVRLGGGGQVFAAPKPSLIDVSSTKSAFRAVQTLKDISGSFYVGQGSFVVVHDAKANENSNWPRVSLMQLPYDVEPGLQWAPLSNEDINWPDDRQIYVDCLENCEGETFSGPNDLESVAGIPGTQLALLCESTNSREDSPVADRIYLAEVTLDADGSGGGVEIKNYTTWSSFTPSYNVEATAVAATDRGYLFMWAERDQPIIFWTDMMVEPFSIGQHVRVIQHKQFKMAGPLALSNRPVVALDVDEVTGDIFMVSSYDLEGDSKAMPNPPYVDADNGPYYAASSMIGKVNKDGTVTIKDAIGDDPQTVRIHNGFKVEAISRAQKIPVGAGATPHDFATKVPGTFIGTDDENWGGTMRKISLPSQKLRTGDPGNGDL